MIWTQKPGQVRCLGVAHFMRVNCRPPAFELHHCWLGTDFRDFVQSETAVRETRSLSGPTSKIMSTLFCRRRCPCSNMLRSVSSVHHCLRPVSYFLGYRGRRFAELPAKIRWCRGSAFLRTQNARQSKVKRRPASSSCWSARHFCIDGNAVLV